MRTLKDNTVVITGASAGIGLACAEAFIAKEARVIMVARGAARLQKVAASLGERATPLVADVGTDAGMARIVEHLDADGRPLDILVNNAGLHHRGAFADNGADEVAEMVAVNLRGPIRLTRLCLPRIRAQRGAIINVASLAGCVPVPNSAVYSATKFGLRAFSLALAAEEAVNGVSVSVVSPGPVDTGFIMDDLASVSDITLSQPIVSGAHVARAILRCAEDGKLERKLPFSSGLLTTVGYVFPSLKWVLQPLLERKGARVKRRLLAKQRLAIADDTERPPPEGSAS